EQSQAVQIIRICRESGPLLVLHPNHDAGREGIVRAIEAAKARHVAHLPRAEFVGLMRRVEVLVGNSSAGLIEVAALGVPAVNLGPRQGGREMPGNVIDLPRWTSQSLVRAIADARERGHAQVKHPYGDGRAGARTAELLATLDFATHGLRKRNTY
ncbi:MAG: UDP-N-acetylglucosamine 2-epimerase, partial [Myxococcota bacterium]